MTENRTTITLSPNLRDQAKEYGINISEVCRNALELQVRYWTTAQAAGQYFEPVETVRHDTGGAMEQVRFNGMPVWEDPDSVNVLYITPKGNAVWVPDEDTGMDNLGPIDHLWQHSNRIPGVAIQAAEEAAGLIPTVTELDI